MKSLLAATAAIEAGTGLGLLAAPSALARLLLGATLDAPAALTLARAAGAALLALSIACWLARYDTQSCAARGLVSAMALYNLGVGIILIAAGIGPLPGGIGLWPAVILHTVMTVWCVTSLLKKPANLSS
jgi:hypothetical protein